MKCCKFQTRGVDVSFGKVRINLQCTRKLIPKCDYGTLPTRKIKYLLRRGKSGDQTAPAKVTQTTRIYRGLEQSGSSSGS